jgi:hypothetical protein
MMADDTARPDGSHDGDSADSSFERAIAAHRHGLTPNIDLDPGDQDLFDDLLPWIDALHIAAAQVAAEQAPALVDPGKSDSIRSDDPIALMLGLVPDADTLVEGRKLAHARKQAKLDLGQLLDRLRARGWEIDTREGLRWELGQASLPPALIAAIASELGIAQASLLATPKAGSDLDDLFTEARVAAFLADWAAEAGVAPGVLRARASATLAGAAHRNRTAGSVDALLDVLRTLRAIPDFLAKP